MDNRSDNDVEYKLPKKQKLEFEKQKQELIAIGRREAEKKYNITPEYIVSERYSSVDPWFTPWQPNGSGAGRLNGFLLDYYGERVIG